MNCTPDQEDFLDRIYKSQKNQNMFQATLSLEMEYGVSPEEAQELIINWMKTYETRNYKRANRPSNKTISKPRRENQEIEQFRVAG